MSIEIIEKKIARILEYVNTLEGMQENCVQRMKQDKIYRGSVMYYLYMMADSCVALAEMMIRKKDLPRPQSYSEAIDILGEHAILPEDFAYDFSRIAGFRNFLAHDYEKVDYEEICKIMLTKLEEVKKYLELVKDNL
ncbi:DUF86 domain-containing protein [candidate division KSB1 bacterium]|nr:DUF86 domain-containing protein [candidate division KSB1 bacterium]NIS23909.1 DUF86 domain-containing protein [candidate division KSB1 bacterium]NIT70826.1 DUF86 domain-containing protein [candidate division KSB1 bacterium]NIU24558.1 DUF86 domain-containing protein [candidate division KSB1 bacterium]NIU94512.1 DUF86 domain-containing protein [candidate division KSB1 bacterium]